MKINDESSNKPGGNMSEEESTNEDNQVGSKIKLKKIGLKVFGGLLILVLLAGGFYGYLYASTPSHLRSPEFEHYHLRAQIVVDGELVDFSREEFQEEYDATSCSAEITGQPIDFHDDTDQMAHVHWRGITGGEFLKFYGWNLIGGEDDSLGRRYDQGMMSMHRIETAGSLLPEAPEGADYYIYVGDKDGYEQKDWNEFLNMDLEDFLGKKSFPNNGEDTSFNVFDLFTQKTYAHGGVEVDEHDEAVEGEDDQERLERINNLIGNVVIFAQDTEPTDEQILERFNNLVPLHDSVCGG